MTRGDSLPFIDSLLGEEEHGGSLVRSQYAPSRLFIKTEYLIESEVVCDN